MKTDKLSKLKIERDNVERLLNMSLPSCKDANVVLNELAPYFEKIDQMQEYQPLGRIKLERLFLEGPLGENKELFSCYARFSLLVEGVFL